MKHLRHALLVATVLLLLPSLAHASIPPHFRPTDDYLQETSGNTASILYGSPNADAPQNGFTFQYWSPHDPVDPDGDATSEPSGDDYAAKYYAQALFAVSLPVPDLGAPYRYAALRIEPDRLSVVYFDGGSSIEELDSTAVTSEANTWYTVALRLVAGGPDGVTLAVERSGGAGDAVARLMLSFPVSKINNLNLATDAIGFTVGDDADYHFRLKDFADNLDSATSFTTWAYDPFGRKIAQQHYDASGDWDGAKFFVWDGPRLFQELASNPGDTAPHLTAQYLPGPGYLDDVFASQRDQDDDGTLESDELLFHLTDQQYSTIALLNADGTDITERYAYDPFGAPTFYNGTGTPIPASAFGNNRLYTGRDWLPALGLYDYTN